jgi:hypothetical protein
VRVSWRRADEEGATLVLMVLVLVVLLGTSALVIDLGLARSERRKFQNAADASALGGAQDLPDLAVVIAQATNLGDDNMTKYTPNWATCVDDQPLAQVSVDSPCISFDSSYTRVRVRIPRQTFPRLLSGIFGSDLSASAAAVAQLRSVGGGGLLPFVLFSGFGTGEACLNAGGGGGSEQPCNGPTSGNFGDLDFHQYGNPDLNTTPSCSNGNTQARLAANIAMGADHQYSTHATGTGTGIDDDCTQPGPNMVAQGTGNGQAFDDGLLSGANFSDGHDARLQRVPVAAGWQTASVTGDTVDNRPLWEFIPSGAPSGVPDKCWRSTFDNLLTATPASQRQVVMHWALDRCIFEYACGKTDTSTGPTDPRYTNHRGVNNCASPRAGTANLCAGSPCTAPVFTADTDIEPDLDIPDIVRSPRMNYVPQVWEPDVTCPGGSGGYCYHIKQFRAIFFQRVLANNAKQLDFEPGNWNTKPVGGNHQAAAVTAWVFPPTMLPGSLGNNPFAIGENTVVQLIG